MGGVSKNVRKLDKLVVLVAQEVKWRIGLKTLKKTLTVNTADENSWLMEYSEKVLSGEGEMELDPNIVSEEAGKLYSELQVKLPLDIFLHSIPLLLKRKYVYGFLNGIIIEV